MFIIEYPIFKYVKGFLAEKLRKRVCKLAIVCFRGLGCGIASRVSHDIERGARQKVWIHNCCICKKSFILKELFLVAKANYCICSHFCACSKCSRDQYLGLACQHAKIFTNVHRTSSTQAYIA